MTNGTAYTSKATPNSAPHVKSANLMADQFSSAVQQQLERSAKALTKGSGIARANMEAAMAASTAATRGMQTLATQAAERSGKSTESFLEGLKALTGAKTASELVAAQQAFVQACSSDMTLRMQHMSKTLVQTAQEMLTPWSGSLTAVFEQMSCAPIIKPEA